MAGVAGLTFPSEINWCDAQARSKTPAETLSAPNDCRTLATAALRRQLLHLSSVYQC
jgi:hypothetical protein